MKPSSIYAHLFRCRIAFCLLVSLQASAFGDDVAYIQSQQIARLSIMPLNPTTSDVITFTAPLDGTIHGNECEMRSNLRGAPLISRDETNQTITLSTDGVFTSFCSRIYIPHSGAEGEFGPLNAGSWTFRDGFGNELAFQVSGSSLAGDFDSNGSYTTDDIDALVFAIATGNSDESFDLNGDGAINTVDRDTWLAIAGAELSADGMAMENGDVNLDGIVDSTDLGQLLNSFDSRDVAWSGGELNGDAIVNSADLGLLLNNFSNAATSHSAVPEPSGTMLGWITLLVGMTLRRRLRSA